MLKKLVATVIGAAIVYKLLEMKARDNTTRPARARFKNPAPAQPTYPLGFRSLERWRPETKH